MTGVTIVGRSLLERFRLGSVVCWKGDSKGSQGTGGEVLDGISPCVGRLWEGGICHRGGRVVGRLFGRRKSHVEVRSSEPGDIAGCRVQGARDPLRDEIP